MSTVPPSCLMCGDYDGKVAICRRCKVAVSPSGMFKPCRLSSDTHNSPFPQKRTCLAVSIQGKEIKVEEMTPKGLRSKLFTPHAKYGLADYILLQPAGFKHPEAMFFDPLNNIVPPLVRSGTTELELRITALLGPESWILFWLKPPQWRVVCLVVPLEPQTLPFFLAMVENNRFVVEANDGASVLIITPLPRDRLHEVLTAYQLRYMERQEAPRP